MRYPLVELATGVAFAAIAVWLGLSWALPAFWYLAAISIALGLIDLAVHRLPDPIVLPSYLVGGVLLGVASLAAHDGGSVVRAAIGGAALWLLYLVLVLIYPAGMGPGDVKLAGVLGVPRLARLERAAGWRLRWLPAGQAERPGPHAGWPGRAEDHDPLSVRSCWPAPG